MNNSLQRSLYSGLFGVAILAAALLHPLLADESKGTENAANDPVQRPPLEHYAALWEQSRFTSERIVTQEPTASFAEHLTLVGLYEVDGKTIAVVMDKQTSLFTDIDSKGTANQSLKLLKVEPGATPEKTRVLLQSGSQSGWLAFPDLNAPAGKGPPSVPAANTTPKIPPPFVPAPQSIVPPANDGLTAPSPLSSVPDIRTEAPKPVPTS